MSSSDTKVGPKDVRFTQVSLYKNKGCSILTYNKIPNSLLNSWYKFDDTFQTLIQRNADVS